MSKDNTLDEIRGKLHLLYNGMTSNSKDADLILKTPVSDIVLQAEEQIQALITETEDKLLIRIAEKTNKEYDWSEVDNWIFAYGSDLRDVYINRKLYKQLKEKL